MARTRLAGSEKARLIAPSGRADVEIVGSRAAAWSDLYHHLIGAEWWQVIAFIALAFLLANLLFALAYLATDGIAGARAGSFSDAFFFSVQTMGTIGYGTMSPKNLAGNMLVTLESITGLVGLAVVTGLVFAKFSRPRARVMFSRFAIIAPRDGVQTLMFRMANERANYIGEAQLTATLLRTETTLEGESLRKLHDLHLVRSRSPTFVLSWTALHPLTKDSPLHGVTPESLKGADCEIIVTLTGLDATLSQTIHARHSYLAEEVLFNVRFADVLSTLPNGRRRVDYSRFHEVIPLEPTKKPAATRASSSG
jgi:inward rectifier potassium channel